MGKKRRFLIMVLIPPFLCLLLGIVAYVVSIPISYFFSPASRIGSIFDLAVDGAIFYLVRSILYLVVFGLWYSHIRFPGWMKNFGAPVKKEKEKLLWSAGYLKPLPLILLLPLGVLLRLFLTALLAFFQNIWPVGTAGYSRIFQEMTSGEPSLLYLLSLVFLLPLAEEIIFRGITLHYAELALSVLPAILISALFSGIYQLSLLPGLWAFATGILLGFLQKKSGGLLPPLLLHIVMQLTLYLLPKSFPGSIPVSLLTAIGALLLSVVLSLVILRLYDGKRPFPKGRPNKRASKDRKPS